MTLPKINLATIGIAIGAVIGVIVLAAVLFVVFFPTDLAAREAERRIEEATGRELVLGGDVEITFWPALGFSAEQASLSNPNGFDNETPFIAADRIVFAVAVMPLLRGSIEVKRLIFEGARLQLEAKPDGAANWDFPTEADAETQQTTLEDLRLDDVRMVNGEITFRGGDGGEPIVLSAVDASIALESLDQPAQLDAAFEYRGERLEVDGVIGAPRAMLEQGETPLTIRARAAPLEAAFDGAFNAGTGVLAGAMQADGDSLRRLLAWMGSPLGEGGGFGPFSMQAQMSHQGETTAFTNAAIRLDAIEARGDISLVNQENGRLRIDGALNAGAIDLNPYLPAPTQGEQAGVQASTAWSDAPLDLTGLRALDAGLSLNLAGLQFQRMNFTNVALNLRIANGAADARLTRLSLYDGSGTARLIADGSGAMPRIAVELNAQNIQAEPLLRDAIGFDRIAGRGNLRASLVGAGGSQAALMRSLHGASSFTFNDGQWKGVNLASIARTVQAALTGQTGAQGGATDFAELAADFTVSNGVAATDNLRLLNPFVRLEGRGVIDIGGQTIDVRLAPRAVRSIEGQGGNVSEAGLGVPFRAVGPWSRVQFRPALEDVVQDQLRRVLSERGGDDPLARLGESLFGRGQATTPAPEGETAQAPEGEQAAEQPAQEQPRSVEDQARDRAREALGGLFGTRDREKQETTP